MGATWGHHAHGRNNIPRYHAAVIAKPVRVIADQEQHNKRHVLVLNNVNCDTALAGLTATRCGPTMGVFLGQERRFRDSLYRHAH